MKRLAINPAGLRPCCVETALSSMAHTLEMPEGTMETCMTCNRQLMVKEGKWRAFPERKRQIP